MANSLWCEMGRTMRHLLLGRTTTTKRSGSRPSLTPRGVVKAPLPPRSGDRRLGDRATRDANAKEARSLRIEYSPNPDGAPDPGEIVWTWVPFEENDGRGKDRPVLIIGQLSGGAVAGCYLSTKEHRGFVPVGTGGWDSQGHPSYLAPDRLLRVTDEGMRREGHVLARDHFDRAVSVVVRQLGIGGR